jgi:hypothetical protein
MSTEPGTVDRPPHPLDQMTTFELRDYRRQLERALDEVQAEQAERARPAAGA